MTNIDKLKDVANNKNISLSTACGYLAEVIADLEQQENIRSKFKAAEKSMDEKLFNDAPAEDKILCIDCGGWRLKTQHEVCPCKKPLPRYREFATAIEAWQWAIVEPTVNGRIFKDSHVGNSHYVLLDGCGKKVLLKNPTMDDTDGPFWTIHDSLGPIEPPKKRWVSVERLQSHIRGIRRAAPCNSQDKADAMNAVAWDLEQLIDEAEEK